MTREPLFEAERYDRKCVPRIVYWANHGGDWRRIAWDAGYSIVDQYISPNTMEYRLSRDGNVQAVLARIDREFFAFVFAPEARHWRDRVRYKLRAVVRMTGTRTNSSRLAHEEHAGPFCPICGLTTRLLEALEEYRDD